MRSIIVAGCLVASILLPSRALAAKLSPSPFALDPSLYPAETAVGGRLISNRMADEMLGPLHHTYFTLLGRIPERGWFQGGVWQPSFDVRGRDGREHHHSAVLITSYLVSEYPSARAAKHAVLDMYLLDGGTWQYLGIGTAGRIFREVNNGYTVINAAYAEGKYDVEDVSLFEPHTPTFYRGEMRAALRAQLDALDTILAGQR